MKYAENSILLTELIIDLVLDTVLIKLLWILTLFNFENSYTHFIMKNCLREKFEFR